MFLNFLLFKSFLCKPYQTSKKKLQHNTKYCKIDRNSMLCMYCLKVSTNALRFTLDGRENFGGLQITMTKDSGWR